MNAVDVAAAPAAAPPHLHRQVSTTFGRQKLEPRHFERLAIVYVRQSDPQQVLKHRESTALQYNQADLAVEMGWPRERVLVIDEDLGISGRHAEGRNGFQRMMAEVALNHVGIILGREMSRLARSCKDWYQLLEVCGVFGTVLGDQDGVYNPADYHDRLLLGLTGIMSEAELHVMRGRLHAGLMNKARRGELVIHPPLGYVRLPSDEIALEPDEQAQAVVRLVFAKFEELGSVIGVLRYLARHDIRLGVRPHFGPHRGQLEWRRPTQPTLYNMLRHPLYAGAYSYGRHPTDPRRVIAGRPSTGRRNVPHTQCAVLLKDRHPAYISWERFEANQRQLEQNRFRSKSLGAPRNGVALLSGLLVCGKCGGRMMVSYGTPRTKLKYTCQIQRSSYGLHRCQSIVGSVLDELIGLQALRVLEPAALELSMAAVANIERERQRLTEHWTQRCERARYETQRAARQYHAVEPENRLVARQLERNWEQAILELRSVEEEYERFQQAQPAALTASECQQIASLSGDIPAIWNSPAIAPADRQAILRHLIERVVVEVQGQTEMTDVAIHWAGGFVSRHEVVRPVRRYDQLRDYDRLAARIRELQQAGWNSHKIADQLNQEGFRPPKRAPRYNGDAVRQIASRDNRREATRKISPPRERPTLGQDEWLLNDLARELSIPRATLYFWHRRLWLQAWIVRVGNRKHLVAWADAEERERLRRLCVVPLGKAKTDVAAELIKPKPRPQP